MGSTEAEIAKTLSFLVEENPILIVVAGYGKIDNHKYKGEFHKKAKMIPFESVEELIGHALKRFDYVYPACGSSNSAVKLTIAELEQASECTKWLDICKGAE